MAEDYRDDTEAAALSGTVDAATGLEFLTIGAANWYAHRLRFLEYLARMLARTANALRLYKDDAGALKFGVRPGRLLDGATLRSYAGATGQDLTDDATNYVWITSAGALDKNTTGFPDASATPHVRLATVATGTASQAAVSGAYSVVDITDYRDTAMLSLASALTAAQRNSLAVMTSHLAKRPATAAWGAIDFTGRPADDELLTIGGRKYEIDDDADFPQSGGDVQVDTSGNATLDEDLADLAAAINGDGSATVSAVADTTRDILWLTAKTAGAAGNSISVVEGLSNATARAATLRDGADAAVAAVVAIRHTITANDAAQGHLRIDTGLSSIESVQLTFEDAGVEETSAVTVGISGGVITMDEGGVAWADGDVLNILAIGTE